MLLKLIRALASFKMLGMRGKMEYGQTYHSHQYRGGKQCLRHILDAGAFVDTQLSIGSTPILIPLITEVQDHSYITTCQY